MQRVGLDQELNLLTAPAPGEDAFPGDSHCNSLSDCRAVKTTSSLTCVSLYPLGVRGSGERVEVGLPAEGSDEREGEEEI